MRETLTDIVWILLFASFFLWLLFITGCRGTPVYASSHSIESHARKLVKECNDLGLEGVLEIEKSSPLPYRVFCYER